VIVDVGGRDIKIIVLKHGRVKDFRLNTQCSAGHGYFLQAIAQNRGIPVERSGTPFFAFKNMDENRPAGSIKLRLETIGHSLRRHQERLAQRRRAEARIGRWISEYERRLQTRIDPEPSPRSWAASDG
jgi:hypothetical protein